MPSTLSAQGIIQRAFDEQYERLSVTEVDTANPFTAPADLSIQGILQRCFDDTTERLRVVSV